MIRSLARGLSEHVKTFSVSAVADIRRERHRRNKSDSESRVIVAIFHSYQMFRHQVLVEFRRRSLAVGRVVRQMNAEYHLDTIAK